jgi:hypothetical protein
VYSFLYQQNEVHEKAQEKYVAEKELDSLKHQLSDEGSLLTLQMARQDELATNVDINVKTFLQGLELVSTNTQERYKQGQKQFK